MGMLEYRKENESGLIKTLITGKILIFIFPIQLKEIAIHTVKPV